MGAEGDECVARIHTHPIDSLADEEGVATDDHPRAAKPSRTRKSGAQRMRLVSVPEAQRQRRDAATSLEPSLVLLLLENR